MIAFVDARRGISGSSLLAALLDAGADGDDIADRLGSLLVPDAKLHVEETVVDGLRTSRVRLEDANVRVADGPHDLIAGIAKAELPQRARERAADVYRRLASAEARVHGVEPEAVRFEELATLRSVVGVTGSVLALEQLGIRTVISSAVPFGGGTIETHHGRIPLPAPATLELLRSMPVEAQTIEGELVTPTGAALLASIATFGAMPSITIRTVGVGSAPSGDTSIVTRVVLGVG